MSIADVAVPALAAWGFAALWMSGVWAIQRRIGNAGIVDPAWALCIGFLAVAFAAGGGGPLWARFAVGGLAGLWSARLALHLVRRLIGAPEDRRYAALKREWGEAAQRRMFLFYQAQAFSCALLALPFLAVLAAAPAEPGPWAWLGIAIGLAAILGESVADRQLVRWKADPGRRGAICDAGLWGWSRHPNYFFEWLHWWAYVALAAGSPWMLLALTGPVAMGHFLLNVTGIPATERHMVETRGDAYRDYQRHVSAFVPWPPSRAAR